WPGASGARGTSERSERNQERPPRAGNKRPRYATLRSAEKGGAQRVAGCEELATNERITTAFVHGGDPELVEGERTRTGCDGSPPGADGIARAQGRAPCGRALGTDALTRESMGSYFKMLRRHAPEQVTKKIIGSPGGAT
ncbi:MAG: hypothetical protein WCO77_12965, partial [bacterium]